MRKEVGHTHKLSLTFLKFAAEGLVQQRPLQRFQCGELSLVETRETLSFGPQCVERSHDRSLLIDRRPIDFDGMYLIAIERRIHCCGACHIATALTTHFLCLAPCYECAGPMVRLVRLYAIFSRVSEIPESPPARGSVTDATASELHLKFAKSLPFI